MRSDIKETENRYVGGVYSVALFPDPARFLLLAVRKSDF